jgi:hypothetical protein
LRVQTFSTYTADRPVTHDTVAQAFGAGQHRRTFDRDHPFGQRGKVFDRETRGKVNVHTTVQEKAIALPTDARLYHKARRVLV